MDLRQQLYSRQQLGQRAKLDNSTLNYWAREGVLRPISGGQGSGGHRRFPYYEVNVAAILNELRTFGVGMPDLRKLADRYHDAIDWMHARGISRDNWEIADELHYMRRSVLSQGYTLVRLDRAPEYADRPRQHAGGGSVLLQVGWDEATKVWMRGLHDEPPSPTLFGLIKVFEDDEQLEAYRRYWSDYLTVTRVAPERPIADGGYIEYFYRDEAGDWHVAIDETTAASKSISFIGIDTARLSYRSWCGDLNTAEDA